MKKTQLTYSIRRETSGGYTQVYVTIIDLYINSARDHLAGTVGNRDGYQHSEAAAKMGNVFSEMLDSGINTYYDVHFDSHCVTTQHQLYSTGEDGSEEFCEARINFPQSIKAAKWALQLLEKLGKRIEKKAAEEYFKIHNYECTPCEVRQSTFENPSDITAALDAIGAVQVEKWEASRATGFDYPPAYWVEKGSVRHV